MSRVCQITGKRVISGNNVAHSNKRTKRIFQPNLFKKRFYFESEDRYVSLKVSAAGIRLINKIGLKEALKRAQEKGYIKSY